jgi:hypothetical protein
LRELGVSIKELGVIQPLQFENWLQQIP